MRFLSREPKVSIGDFCQQFYDSRVVHASISGMHLWATFLDDVSKSVTEADQSFSGIEVSLFRREMTALRLELFALAWGHRFKGERFTIPQSIFTRSYLEGNGQLEIWDIMGEYNRAVAESATLTVSGEQMEGRIARARITALNISRANMFDKWAEANIDNPSAPTEEESTLANCVARVASRIGADLRREDSILVKHLTARLADRLNCDPDLNIEALFSLGALIYGLYEGAAGDIRAVH